MADVTVAAKAAAMAVVVVPATAVAAGNPARRAKGVSHAKVAATQAVVVRAGVLTPATPKVAAVKAVTPADGAKRAVTTAETSAARTAATTEVKAARVAAVTTAATRRRWTVQPPAR
jgi:hypothetical protein